jgi:hypothetical protein
MHLKDHGFLVLTDIGVQGAQDSWLQLWPTTKDLGLKIYLEIEWRAFTRLLSHNAIFLLDEEDRLVWTWNRDFGTITAKLGFFFFLSKKYILYIRCLLEQKMFPKYKMKLAEITGLPQQRGNQSSQPPFRCLRQLLMQQNTKVHPISQLV